jgi:hypothetical protein
MIADNQLVIGIVLITIGIAFGLLAYAVMLNRREAGKDEQNMDEGEVPGEVPVEQLSPEPGGEPEEEREEEQTIFISEDQIPEPPAQEKQASIPEVGVRIPIATLARDEVTGKLIVSMGDQDYRDPADIDDDVDRRKLEFAASDLAVWFETKLEPDLAFPVEETSEPKHRGMIEEINDFLKMKLRHLPAEKQAVRLAEGAGGGVKVYVGIDSYALEEVPDENVKQLIREAVADWEANQ